MKFIYDLDQMMAAGKVILTYRGDFTQDTTRSILDVVEQKLEFAGEEAGIRKKIFKVMVEALQNIVKHSDEGKDGDHNNHRAAIFRIGHEPGQYSIMSGNPVKNTNLPALKNAMERINSLDKEGLNRLHKEIMENTRISDKGGAGLGFVDMARKSGEKLQWTFVPMNGELSFFCLKVNIPAIRWNSTVQY